MTMTSHHVILGRSLLLLLFLLSPAAAQQSPSAYDNNYGYGNNISPSVGVIIIVLVAALFLIGFFSMYVRHCSGDDSTYDPTRRLTAGQAGRSVRGPRGLDSTIIESFPTFDYSAVKSLKIGKGALECAVCLNEFQDDETLRLIPKCDHVFHPDCIDAWLLSHTTCPVCRANLAPQPGESLHGPQLAHITEAHQAHNDHPENEITVQNDAVIDVVAQPVCETEAMERPLNAALPPSVPRLNRNRTRRNTSGRPRWLGRYSRSNSTGHVAVKQWENMERFTLRLPEEVRRQLISGKLTRSASCVALPREGSSRRGYRAGPGGPTGEGSSRGRSLFGSWRFDRAARSDRWVFSLAPPFFSRAPSVRSTKVAAASGGDGESVRSSKANDSVHATAATEANLPPV